MEYKDNFPNSWKSGYSSSDDPDRVDYSPAGWENSRREGMRRSEERELEEARRRQIAENERRQREKMEAEQAKIELQRQQLEKRGEKNFELREQAVKIIVEQKRGAFDKYNLLKKAVLKMQGRSFEQMKFKIISDAEKRVDKMSNEEVRTFIEANEGRKR